jgi:hypothetical protein
LALIRSSEPALRGIPTGIFLAASAAGQYRQVMEVPPPLPRKSFSPFLLIALFLLLIAVGIRTFLAAEEEEEVIRAATYQLAITVGGVVCGLAALLFSIVALFFRRRGRFLSIFVGVAGLGMAALLSKELPQSIERVKVEVERSNAAGVALARQPIPQEKDAQTDMDLRPALIAWGEEAWVRPYQEHGHHDPAWDEPALQLIRGTFLQLMGSAIKPGIEHLRALSAQIQNTACDDPWILFLVRRLGEDDPDFREVMEKAADAVAAAGYPPAPTWLARVQALGVVFRDEPTAAAARVPGCLESLRAALSAKSLEAVDYRVWCQFFLYQPSEIVFQVDGEGAPGVVESIPGTAEWFRLWMRGRAEVEQAWQARGGGWANTVTPDGWKRFGTHLAIARGLLERALKMQPNQPEIARALLTVELGSSGLEEMRPLFEQAVRARFDYMPAYLLFHWGVEPRWFGSEEAQLAFGRSCLATQRFDTQVPWEMVRTVEDIADDKGDRDAQDAYYHHQAPWEDLRTVFDGYIAHGDPARRNYYLSVKTVLAAKRGLDSVVAQLLQDLHYEIDPQVKADWNLSVQWIPRMTALTGPACSLAVSAERQTNDHPEQALQNLLSAQKLPGLLPMTTEYFAGQIASLRSLVALQASPWLPLTPPQDLSGWKVGGGEWKVVAPGVLELKTGGSVALLTRVEPMGDTWEVRGEFELPVEGSGRTEAALFCGPPGAQEEHGFSLRFWSHPHNSTGISLARGFNTQAFSKGAALKRVVPFIARLENRRLRVSAAKELWYAEQPLPEGVEIADNAQFSLGSTGGSGRTIRFRNLEWRKPAQENEKQ